jgi:hypothetical protein
MFDKHENIRIINFDSIIIVLIIFFGALTTSNSFGNISVADKKPVTASVSLYVNCAEPVSFVRLQVFQKTWISNKDNFNILAFNRSPVTENKKTKLKIFSYLFIRNKFPESPGLFLRPHLFPSESDDHLQLS